MVKQNILRKDIKNFEKEYKVPIFFYDELHNKNVNSDTGYDYNKLINRSKQVCGRDITDELKKLQIIDDEKKINIGFATHGGGGVNNENTIFCFDKDDYLTIYHEMAHSMQKNFVSDEKLDMVYRFWKKKTKSNTNSKLFESFIYKMNYTAYLKEMHAEAFSYGVDMLYAKNKWQLLMAKAKCFRSAYIRTFSSVSSTEKDYNVGSHKFYASKPVLKALVKEMQSLKKNKQDKQFFNDNGDLNLTLFSKHVEKLVYKNAYSPRVFNHLLNSSYFYSFDSKDRGFRLDALKSSIIFPMLVCSDIARSFSFNKNMCKHKILDIKKEQKYREKINNDINNVFNNKNIDEEMRAIIAVDVINKKMSKVLPEFSVINNEIKASIKSNHFILNDCNLSKGVINNIINCMKKNKKNKTSPKQIMEFRNLCKEINMFGDTLKDNKYFTSAWELDKDLIVEKRQEKENNPAIMVINTNEPQTISRGPSAYVFYIDIIQNAKNFNKQYAIKDENILISSFFSGKINSKEFKNKIIKEYAPKKSLFNKKAHNNFIDEFEQFASYCEFSDYMNKGNHSYKSTKQALNKMSDMNECVKHIANLILEDKLGVNGAKKNEAQSCKTAYDEKSQPSNRIGSALGRLNKNTVKNPNLSHDVSTSDLINKVAKNRIDNLL